MAMNQTLPRALARSLARTTTKPCARTIRSASTSTSTPTTIPITTPTTTTSTSLPPPPPPPPPPRPSFLRRRRRALLWSLLGLSLGSTLGFLISHTIAPPPHPAAFTPEDSLLMTDLESRIDAEFKVKVLRGKCTAAAAGLRGDTDEEGERAAWRELPRRKSESTLVGRTLAGAGRLGTERVFWNQRTGEVVAVVWFGGATSGWPGVAHGGCIATVMEEKMALAARLAMAKGDAGVVTEGVLVGAGAECRRVRVNYKKPTYANAFYVVRMLPRVEEDGGVDGKEVEVEGTLETLDGKLCVAVTGTVPVSGTAAGVVDAPLATVQRAKTWIGWPSRSDASQS